MFEIQINCAVLKNALTMIASTVGKGNNSANDCICMSTSGGGLDVKIYTTNDIEFSEVDCIIIGGGTTVEKAPYVDFKRFKSIIDSIDDNETIDIKEYNGDLAINFDLKPKPFLLTGKSMGVVGLPQNQFGAPIILPCDTVFKSIKHVSKMMDFKSYTAKPIQKCIRIYTNGNSIETTAIDMNSSRAYCQVDVATINNGTIEAFIEPDKLLKAKDLFKNFRELNIYMDTTTIKIEGDSVINNNGPLSDITNVKYYCQRLAGAYPTTISNGFSPKPTEWLEFHIDDLKSLLLRAEAIRDSANNDSFALFEVTKATGTISKRTIYGNMNERFYLNNSINSSFHESFNVRHLLDIMSVIGNTAEYLKLGILPTHTDYAIVKPVGMGDTFEFMIPTKSVLMAAQQQNNNAQATP